MDPKDQPMDYTVQWAEFYRSVGMIREAEELEYKFLMVRLRCRRLASFEKLANLDFNLKYVEKEKGKVNFIQNL